MPPPIGIPALVTLGILELILIGLLRVHPRGPPGPSR